MWAGLALLVWALAGCGINVDGPRTPTIAASPTLDATAVALRASPTPTLAPSATASPLPSESPAPTGTATPPPSDTPTVTATASLTATVTASATATLPPSPTRTPTHTTTPQPTATRTLAPSATPSRAPTITPRPSRTPSATGTRVPSATPTSNATATAVFTPTPAATTTPAPTLTPSALPTLDPGEGGGDNAGLIATWTPSPTPGAVAGVPTGQAGEGAFVDPNAPTTGQESAPVAPEAPPGDTAPGGPTMPEEEQIVVSYVGEVVPYLSLVGVAGGSEPAPLGQGTIFDVSSAGQVATVGENHWLTINGEPVVVSPASQFGPPANLSLGAVEWSPDGQYVALRVDDATPGSQTLTNGGVWIYDLTDPANPQSRQIFRNGYPGLVEQRGDERVASGGLVWSPDGSRLVIPVTTWYEGADAAPGVVVVSRDVDVNDANLDPAAKVPLALPFGGATWTLDGTALIVSGPASGGASVVGRWDLVTGEYMEYTNQGASGLAMQAAAALPDGWIGFLGSTTPGRDVALYLLPASPGAPMSPAVSPTIPGEVIAAEWNPARTAIMVLARTETGDRLWLVQSNGTAQDITPPGGAPASIDWR